LRWRFSPTAPAPAAGGQVTLSVNGTEVGGGRIQHTVPQRFTAYAGMDVGHDNGGVVELAYASKAPFPFTARINKVTFDLAPRSGPTDETAAQHHAAHSALANGIEG
jgi:arylsulfatase